MENQDLGSLRHSAAHLLAAAVKELWPGSHNAIGPSIEDGFYQDFEIVEGATISENDFPKIEKRMKQILNHWKAFETREVDADEARQLFAENPYKLELIEEFAQDSKEITVNDPGNFLDLCKGGHLESPKEALKNFKLTKVAGAYWRGDEKNQMLTRIYGTAFATAEELDEHLNMLEEAKKRDHRKLGQELDLFTFSPLVGSGLPMFTPKGTVIRQELEKYLRSIQEPLGYQQTDIPHLAKPDLYKTSGHWDKFEENLFHVKGKGDEPFVMKPMNCPHHTQIYASTQRSYRDLPIRFAEVTKVYRDEQAGELQGLSRVRSITQDDAHVFCRPDQIKEIVHEVIEIVNDFYSAFDFELDVHLSIRDATDKDKYLGDDKIWETAEAELKNSLDENKMSCTVDEGEAAFYGPKIDFVAKDSLKRKWQLATIQLDFNMPQRFELTYIDEEGNKQTPVMIHRAIMGATERFMSVLLEHYAGNLPLWLSPVQVAILPIGGEQKDYASKVAEQLKENGIRVEVDDSDTTIGKKIRAAETSKVPMMFVVGQKEQDENGVAVRSKVKGDEGIVALDKAIKDLLEKIELRKNV